MRISDWSSDVCSSDLGRGERKQGLARLDPVGVAIIAGRIEFGGQVQPRFGERLAEPFFALGGRAETGRAAHEADAAMAERDESAHRRSEEHTSELQSLMRISYAAFCLQKKKSTDSKT